MKKLLLLLCLLAILPVAAQKRTFKAACLNVDGLPPTVKAGGVYTVNLNPEGPQAAGTTQISKLVAGKGWDFFGVSENFNYNDELMSNLTGVYAAGTYRGKITDVPLTDVGGFLNGSKHFDTDGLNLLWKTSLNVSGESWTMWNKRNGTTKDGADELIAKGFRYYAVKIAPGLEVDVYILHMDAETTEADNAARESQMNQLVDVILASNNKRPIIIMGDTNCRYTRDRIQEILFGRINADKRFEIHDPWIDYPRGGYYPQVGEGSIMVPSHYDGTNWDKFQTGEVVDKVFYINNTDADGVTLRALNYKMDMEFTWPDGSEIADHFPIVIDFEIENTNTGAKPGEYYIRNAATGEFINQGADYDTRSVLNFFGNRISLEVAEGDGNFYLNTTLKENNGGEGYLGDNLYMDNPTKCVWHFAKIGETNYFTITKNGDNSQALTYSNDSYKRLSTANVNTSDPNQQWELLSANDLRQKMLDDASESNPIDATFFIKDPCFGANNKDVSSWTQVTRDKRLTTFGVNTSGDLPRYGMFVIGGYNTWSTGETKGKMSQTISGLPSGKYRFEFDFVSSTNQGYVTVTSGGNTIVNETATDGKVSRSLNVANAQSNFEHRSSVITVNSGSITIEFGKGHNGKEHYSYFDNFKLTYLGPTAEDLAALERVRRAVQRAAALAQEAHLYSYDNSVVEEKLAAHNISGDGSVEERQTYEALAKAAMRQTAVGADLRLAILNNSFEMGSTVLWDASGATNSRVEASTETGVDGTYVFKADRGTVKQTLSETVPGGVYEISAMLTPGATLYAGSQSATAPAGSGLQRVTVKVIMTANGSLEVGASCTSAFTADCFTMTRVGSRENASAYSWLQIAINEAYARANTVPGNIDLSDYQAMIDNLEIVGDGNAEFEGIFGRLRALVYAQGAPTGNSTIDYTAAIINPDFELGTTMGWNASTNGDTGVKPNSNNTYKMNVTHGTYLFNTWADGAGTEISTTIPGLPGGHYKLKVALSSDQNNCISVTVNGTQQIVKMNSGKETGQEFEMEFDVAPNTAEVALAVSGANSDGTPSLSGGAWYKADNFRLERMRDDLRNICPVYQRLYGVITHLNGLAATLPEPYRSQWDASDYMAIYNEHVASDHKSDPLHSDGETEIADLYQRYRTLVFSQGEVGANMSTAITNNSFELGDLTGWNIVVPAGADIRVTVPGEPGTTYYAAPYDGAYIFNTWKSDQSTPLYTTVKNVPAGRYRFTAKVASDAGNGFYLAVNNVPGEMVTTTDKTVFSDISVEYEVTEDNSEILLGLYPALNGNFRPDLDPLNLGPWFKADNFGITLIGRNTSIDWAMETEDEVMGTIILPFEAAVPANMKVYRASEGFSSKSKEFWVVDLEEVSVIEANTPYIVKNTTKKSVRSRVPSINTVTFSGYNTNDKAEYTDGILTGTHIDRLTADNCYTFVSDEKKGIGFRSVAKGATRLVDAHHAYVNAKDIQGSVPEYIFFKDGENTTSVQDAIDSLSAPVDVYSVDGILIRTADSEEVALEGLAHGIYVVRRGLTSKKVLL